ncbi:MAG TPA: hypothetical protein GXX40_05730 [Firmicutes bacterium]|nr:hypothetical protein [Bacillota bacterium]
MATQGTVTLLGRLWVLDLIAAASGVYVAIGDGTTEPSQADTGLANERFRKAAGIYRDGEQVVAECQVTEVEANFGWKEIGLFVGGSDVAGSGTLLVRALVDEAKDELRTVTVSFEISLT